MKLVLATAFIALAVGFAAMATSCSINHRSDQYTCSENSECDPGRVCDNGSCIVAGSIDATRSDAPKTGDAGGNCPANCTSCNTTLKTCTINCQTANCTNTVMCPAGYKCDILCNVDNSCRNGINCQLGASCNVECTGKSSCQNVQCGAGPCDVGCSGPSSCRGVSCNNSCKCDVACTGNQSCAEGIQCTSFACRSTTGTGCTSVPTFCHTCN